MITKKMKWSFPKEMILRLAKIVPISVLTTAVVLAVVLLMTVFLVLALSDPL